MPQTTYLPLYKASYPILAPAQKPGGVTVAAGVPFNVVGATVAAGGATYAVGNTITLANGVVLTVATLNVTAVATVTITNPGIATTIPGNPQAQVSTSGSGTGATFNLAWAGSVPNKQVYVPPKVQVLERILEGITEGTTGLDYGERFMPEGGEAAGLEETHGAQPQLKSDERFFTPEEEAAADKKAGVKKPK